MSRSFANFLLFEDLFDNLDQTNLTLVTLANQIFAPYVTIVQENCGTKSGKLIDVTPSINGQVKLIFNGVLNPDRTIPLSYRISNTDINTWLGASLYTTRVRELHNCTSLGGVCGVCYASTFNTAAPEVGTQVQIKNQYILHTDSHLTSSSVDTYSISSDPATYHFLQVYLGNVLLEENTDYTLASDSLSLTLTSMPTTGNYLTINSIIYSNKPFLSYLAGTYSGSALGISSITQQPTTLPLGFIDRNISEGQLMLLYDQVKNNSYVDQTTLDFYNSTRNRLEKALFLITVASIYNDIQA